MIDEEDLIWFGKFSFIAGLVLASIGAVGVVIPNWNIEVIVASIFLISFGIIAVLLSCLIAWKIKRDRTRRHMSRINPLRGPGPVDEDER